MILSTLDIKTKKKKIIKYIVASIICIAINFIYAQFGHGVTSNYMTLMFLYPLILGIVCTLLNSQNNKSVANIFMLGIITLTVGSFLNGVLVIAGATSDFIPIYYIFGIIEIVIGIILKIVQI